jgi:hypothetical protein
MISGDEFYIGYERQVPPGLRCVITRVVITIAAVMVLSAIVSTLAQEPLPDARFDYGNPQTFRGWLTREPIPALHVNDSGRLTRYWLVGQGKFGAAAALEGQRDGSITLDASVIARGEWRMLEIVPGSVRRLTDAVDAPREIVASPRQVQLRGEVVDSKCYLGVMNPGAHAAHRDCAVRCLSGGVPPMFAYRDSDGSSHLAVLVGPGGALLGDRWRRLAGTQRALSGQLVIAGDHEVFVVETP